MTHSNDALTQIKLIIAETKGRNLNEADTRHRIIDYILHTLFAWPTNRVSVEEFIKPGYADYVLKKSSGDHLLFIEAKKEGDYFQLPIPHNEDERHSYISIGKLLSDESVNAAMVQVRNYCLNTGCEYAAISNGHEWIFFKTFEKGKRWETLQAFVIRSLHFFDKDYTKAFNQFSFIAINERSSLPSLLTSAPPKDRNIYYAKEKIASYSYTINANRLANNLRSIVSRYFGVIKDDDTEFMERCYVSQREYQDTYDGMRHLLKDSLTPYFKDYGIQQLSDTGKGGHLGGRLTKNLKNQRRSEVLVLFGGKGSGKSTFIKRLLHHNPPRWLVDHGLTAIVDLLNVNEDKNEINSAIWSILVQQLDSEQILKSDRDLLLNSLFSDRFEVAKRQDLAGLSVQSEAYNLQLNKLIVLWKTDALYCCQKLVQYWAQKDKGAIVVIDNTDQYSSEIQDYCFTTAQGIAHSLGCVVLISMREERFYESKIHGVLDAFQNSGFHISSPKPAEVFRKRLNYAALLLSDPIKRHQLITGNEGSVVNDSIKYLSKLENQFLNDLSPLNIFLTACGHGDIRLSLDLFRSFLLSGYTNIDEMLNAERWVFQIHQVIKPVMIPDRYFYDEGRSEIPNMFQLRSTRHGSHFTALRILRKLGKSVDISSPPHVDVILLKAYFIETFNMLEDFELNMDMLLKRGFIESSNRLDKYSDDVDSVRITNYGLFMLNELVYDFVYLDLVCTDCGVFNQNTCNYLSEASRQEFQLFLKADRLGRVNVRLSRVDAFITYLSEEEIREREVHTLGMPINELFTSKSREYFEKEKPRILKSANRQGHNRSRKGDLQSNGSKNQKYSR